MVLEIGPDRGTRIRGGRGTYAACALPGGVGSSGSARAPASSDDEDTGIVPQWRDYLTIFLVSGCILVFQIALTRVLSVVAWYHFAFLTISMVMLGLGAPGVWFALMKRPLRMLPGCLLAAGIAVPISVILIVRYGAVLAAEQKGLGVTIILAVLPAMLALGSVICLLLIKAGGKRITRMYGIDLLGACLGAMLVIPLLHWLPTPALAAGCGFLPLGALALYGKRWRVVALSGVVVLIALISTTQLLEVTRSKSYDEKVLVPVFEKWTPTARLTIFDETLFGPVADQSGFAWGRGSKYPEGTKVLHYWLEQDGNAGTPITKFDGDLAKLEHLEFDVTTVGYQLRPPRRVAVIGAGGGRDILSALRAGAEEIDAIELNRHTIYAVSKDFAHISGDIYHHPNVNAVASEGRSHLTHTGDKFGFIQISLIDSWAASVAGAFALAENNLYTVEAFGLYLDRMTETGQLSTSRWMREMPRLLLLARAAVLEAGFEHPERHMLLVSAGAVGTLLISKTPYERADIERLREIARERGFIIHYPVVPGHAGDEVYTDLIEGRIGFLRDGGYNTEPPRDDSPYFFHVMTPFASSAALDEHTRKLTAIEANWHEANWQAILVLRRVMWAVSGLAVVLFMLPFLFHKVASREGDTRDWAGLVRASLYFAAIGTGFMLLENMLVQHFVLYLGHPSYATTVIIASLLLGMGVGSSMAGRVGVKRLLAWGWVVPVLVYGIVLVLPSLFHATLGLPLAVRILFGCLILLPLGGLLGLFFPLGMLRFGDVGKPWFWAINGVFGVVASVMSLALSMEFGFLMVGQLSALIYLVAWACLRGNGNRASAHPAP